MVKPSAAFLLLLATQFGTAAMLPVLKNDKVAVTEYHLMPSESANVATTHPAAIVYFDGHVEFKPSPAQIRNTGPTMSRFVEIQFLGGGSGETWGAAGLSPTNKIILENHYARIYEIRVPAGAHEPQHTHKNRVIVCLSGAQIKHTLPDGKEEISNLKTGDILWRAGVTHVGYNQGRTDLWVIAVEPK